MAGVLAAIMEFGAGLLHEFDALRIITNLFKGFLLGVYLLILSKLLSAESANSVLEIFLVEFAGVANVVGLYLALVAEVVVAVIALDLVQVAVDCSIGGNSLIVSILESVVHLSSLQSGELSALLALVSLVDLD